MDKTITTVLLVITGVVAAVLVANTIIPAISSSSSSIAKITQHVNDRIETQVRIVHATGELDSSGTWQDTNGNGKFDIYLWVKNVGSSRILAINRMDIFIGTSGTTQRIPHVDDAGGSFPRWNYTVENGAEWTNSVTIKVTITYDNVQSSGTYVVKLVTPSGAYDEYYFSF